MTISRNKLRLRRATRSRVKIFGTRQRPRLVVYKSNKYLEVHAIDDAKHQTLLGVTDKSTNARKLTTDKQIEWMAEQVAQKCKKHNIDTMVFDRSGYQFVGNIAKLVNAIKEKGIKI